VEFCYPATAPVAPVRTAVQEGTFYGRICRSRRLMKSRHRLLGSERADSIWPASTPPTPAETIGVLGTAQPSRRGARMTPPPARSGNGAINRAPAGCHGVHILQTPWQRPPSCPFNRFQRCGVTVRTSRPEVHHVELLQCRASVRTRCQLVRPVPHTLPRSSTAASATAFANRHRSNGRWGLLHRAMLRTNKRLSFG
jgi:hypothetical protein